MQRFLCPKKTGKHYKVLNSVSMLSRVRSVLYSDKPLNLGQFDIIAI